MTLCLGLGTSPEGLSVKTFTGADVFIGNDIITTRDLLIGVFQELTEGTLVPHDPRPQFIQGIATIKQVEGYNPGHRRLVRSAPIMPADKELSGKVISYRGMLTKVIGSHLHLGAKSKKGPDTILETAIQMWTEMSRSDYAEAEDYQISLEDLLMTTDYVLTNTDILGQMDDRLQFVKSLKSGKKKEDKLHFGEPPVFVHQ